MNMMTSTGGPRDRVSRLIAAALDGPAARHPSLHEIAGRLCMSTRTLKRRLRDSGVRYRELLDEARLIRAARLLGETELPLDAIADSVGYSSGANLSRAFRRWTGIAPGRFREQGMVTNRNRLAAILIPSAGRALQAPGFSQGPRSRRPHA